MGYVNMRDLPKPFGQRKNWEACCCWRVHTSMLRALTNSVVLWPVRDLPYRRACLLLPINAPPWRVFSQGLWLPEHLAPARRAGGKAGRKTSTTCSIAVSPVPTSNSHPTPLKMGQEHDDGLFLHSWYHGWWEPAFRSQVLSHSQLFPDVVHCQSSICPE